MLDASTEIFLKAVSSTIPLATSTVHKDIELIWSKFIYLYYIVDQHYCYDSNFSDFSDFSYTHSLYEYKTFNRLT